MDNREYCKDCAYVDVDGLMANQYCKSIFIEPDKVSYTLITKVVLAQCKLTSLRAFDPSRVKTVHE